MRKNIKIAIPMFFAMVLVMGCSVSVNGSDTVFGSGSVNNGKESDATVRKSVKIGKFNKIKASQAIKVIFTQGNFTGEAKVATTPSAEKYLEIVVDDGELEVRYSGNFKSIKGPSIIRVQAPDIKDIDLSSAAQVEVVGNLSLKSSLEVDLSSASSVTMDSATGVGVSLDLSSSSSFRAEKLELEGFDAEMSSASSADVVRLVAKSVRADVSSAAKLTVGECYGENIDVEASSGSDIEMNNINVYAVNADAGSGADITLQGVCVKADTGSSSGGSVNKRKLTVKADKYSWTLKKGATGGMVPPRKP